MIMSVYEWVATVVSFIAILGTIINWINTKDRFEKLDRSALKANKLSERSVEIESAQSILGPLKALATELRKHINSYGECKSETTERNRTVGNLLVFLDQMHDYDRSFLGAEIMELINEIRYRHIEDYNRKSYERESAVYDVEQWRDGRNNPEIITSDDFEMKRLQERAILLRKDLKRVSLSLIYSCENLFELITKEIANTQGKIKSDSS